MTCPKCRRQMPKSLSWIINYEGTGITIRDLFTYTCEENLCMSFEEFPRLSQLHDIITSLILLSPDRLHKPQVKFLLSNLGIEETCLREFSGLENFSFNTSFRDSGTLSSKDTKQIKYIIKKALPNDRYNISLKRQIRTIFTIQLTFDYKINSWVLYEE